MNSEAARLEGVRILICGAANGIGEAIARTCARHGAEVLAVDTTDSDVEARFQGVSRVEGLGLPFRGAGSAAATVDEAGKRLDGLDVVILCAGTQPATPVADAATQDKATRERGKETRTWFDAALPLLKKSPAGRFIVVGLLRSAFSREAQILFDGAAQALDEVVRELAARSGQFGVTVNGIQPGAIMTPESRRVFVDDKALRDYCIQHSAARRLGEPLDVAKVALFLASDDATFVSGTRIVVDGGRTA